PYLFGLGVIGISVFMMGAGTLGVPRRVWDITGADAALKYDYSGAAYLMMGLNGISGVLAALGGLAFIVIIVGSVLFGKRTGDKPLEGLTMTTATKYGSAEHIRIPGTVMLVAVFFTAFVLYYFVNWKYLAEVWPLR
ncbi:MAG: cytochrome C oxidase subunit I, partial [Gammaproteobacteria bacterium]